MALHVQLNQLGCNFQSTFMFREVIPATLSRASSSADRVTSLMIITFVWKLRKGRFPANILAVPGLMSDDESIVDKHQSEQ